VVEWQVAVQKGIVSPWSAAMQFRSLGTISLGTVQYSMANNRVLVTIPSRTCPTGSLVCPIDDAPISYVDEAKASC